MVLELIRKEWKIAKIETFISNIKTSDFVIMKILLFDLQSFYLYKYPAMILKITDIYK